MPEERGKDSLAQFPELQRAREAYITLFKDSLPFTQLAYSPRQIRFVQPAIKLIESQGRIGYEGKTRKKNYLVFSDTDKGMWTTIVRDFPAVMAMRANRDYFRELHASGDLERLDSTSIMILSMENRYKVWDYMESEPDTALVAHVDLVDPTVVAIDDLSSIVKALRSGFFTPNLRKSSPVSRLARQLRLATPYKAVWVDPETKLEFAVVIESHLDPEVPMTFFEIWRKLNPVTDEQGVLVPWGKKANSSQQVVERVFQSENQRVVEGALQANPAL